MVRLFLSVDMAGSTEFKARFTGQAAEGWLTIFQTFFTSFPLMVAGQVGFEFLEDEHSTPAIEVWKVMGDEVLFVATPASAEELTSMLIAFLRTMRLYEEKHFTDLPLRLKGTAWLADIGDFAEMNSVWDSWIDPANPPARATGECRLAAPEFKVEIIVTAACG